MSGTTTAIVLAAGTGSRFGGGKLLATVAGKPLIQHVLDRLVEAGIDDAVVVLGDDADRVEQAIAWRGERQVRNPEPERGLASSLRVGMAALGPDVGAVLIALGDQPLVTDATIRSLLAAPVDPARPVVVARYDGDRGRNPVIVRRAAFGLVEQATGDRGLGPLLETHPELVMEVPMSGTNPDVDTRADLASLVASGWAARVRANRDQVERFRELADPDDFYAPVRSLFRADPTRTDDPLLDELVGRIRPGETWLDVGAGAGRFALPIARALDPSGGSVVAIDPSPSMLDGLREIAEDYGIENIRTVEMRWPPPDPSSFEADVALIVHVGYDIEAIEGFLDGLEAAARRVCLAVLMNRPPAAAAEPFWPPVHGEPRMTLPALGDLIELLEARGSRPSVTTVPAEQRRFESREALEGFVRRQLWIDPSGPKEPRFRSALEQLAERDGDGWTIASLEPIELGVVAWRPRT